MAMLSPQITEGIHTVPWRCQFFASRPFNTTWRQPRNSGLVPLLSISVIRPYEIYHTCRLSNIIRSTPWGTTRWYFTYTSIVGVYCPIKHRSSDRKATSRLLIYAPNYFSITDDDIFMITLNIWSKIFWISRMKYYKSYCTDCLKLSKDQNLVIWCWYIITGDIM